MIKINSTPMYVQADWLSFTVPVPLGLEGDGAEVTTFVIQRISEDLGELLADDLFSMRFDRTGGRAPYTVKATREDHGAVIFWGPKNNHVLVEMGGQGLERIQHKGLLINWLEAVRPRVTRLDIAVDMPVPDSPKSFVDAGYSGKFASTGHLVSESGETCYVGSQKSDRFARVYRYSEPHPRHALLRCEYVFRREQARLVAASILDKGLEATAQAAGLSFGWKHPAWQSDLMTTEKLASWKPDRHKSGTLRWIITQCFPAIAKLHDLGEIGDIDDFLNDHLKPLIK